jgi:hypothetical protein
MDVMRSHDQSKGDHQIKPPTENKEAMSFTSSQYKQIAKELRGLEWPCMPLDEAVRVVADYVMTSMPWKPIYRDREGNILPNKT